MTDSNPYTDLFVEPFCQNPPPTISCQQIDYFLITDDEIDHPLHRVCLPVPCPETECAEIGVEETSP